jgi:fructose-1,6-bisphosphatase/inositol monophosphatase family enzyme
MYNALIKLIGLTKMSEAHHQLVSIPERRQTAEILEIACLDTVMAAMQVVQPAQLGLTAIGESAIKTRDQTFVTPIDKRAEAAAKATFRAALPGVSVVGEETGGEVPAAAKHVGYIDPVDGTIDLLAGAGTATVIVGVRDVEQSQTETVVIGQPISGRVWRTRGGQTIRQVFDVATGDPKSEEVTCRVWDGPLSSKSIVFVETDRGFVREGGRQILSDYQAGRLSESLRSVRKLNSGSNGMHQALVANGGEHVVGSITTAMGGPWDALGARLVIDAGGSAIGLRVTDDRRLEEADPLDPHSYDMLVTANNSKNLDILKDEVAKAMGLLPLSQRQA